MITNDYLVTNMQRLSAANRAALPLLKTIRSSAIKSSEGIVLCNVRDEAELLPHFLKHYREIGVKRFAFVDNGSVDLTVPFLLDQSDCDIFEFNGSFKGYRAGMIWKNLLILNYMSAKWFFSADADEHAIYDGWPDIGLDEFANRMTLKGRSAVTAIMVDMYSGGPIVDARIEYPRSLLETCPFFDGDGYEIRMPENWRAEDCFKLDASGGPISRVFGRKGKFGWLAKTPLILEPSIYFHNPHGVLPVGLNFTPMEIALLHFRFSAALIQKISRVVAYQEHDEPNALRYQNLGIRIREEPDFNFLYPGSVKFKSPQQFIDRSMIGPNCLAR